MKLHNIFDNIMRIGSKFSLENDDRTKLTNWAINNGWKVLKNGQSQCLCFTEHEKIWFFK